MAAVQIEGCKLRRMMTNKSDVVSRCKQEQDGAD